VHSKNVFLEDVNLLEGEVPMRGQFLSDIDKSVSYFRNFSVRPELVEGGIP
jgi:hypothetical protein